MTEWWWRLAGSQNYPPEYAKDVHNNEKRSIVISSTFFVVEQSKLLNYKWVSVAAILLNILLALRFQIFKSKQQPEAQWNM